MKLFERLAATKPKVLLELQRLQLLEISDFTPSSTRQMMKHASYRRVNRRTRQRRTA